MARLLIVHADDLGLSPGVNSGIFSCHADGIVTSTSLITNLPAFEDAVAKLKEYPKLDVGVHLNLTCGRPCSGVSSSASLIGPDGIFRNLPALLLNVLTRRLRPAAIEAEFRAQIERAVQAGLQVTHLDSHRNIHLLPSIAKCVYSVAASFGIKWIRFRNQAPLFFPSPVRLVSVRDWTVAGIAGLLAATQRGFVDRKEQREIVGTPQLRALNLRQMLEATLDTTWEGAMEFVCHPGEVDGELERLDDYTRKREEEMAALRDPEVRSMLRRAGVTLSNYQSLDAGASSPHPVQLPSGIVGKGTGRS